MSGILTITVDSRDKVEARRDDGEEETGKVLPDELRDQTVRVFTDWLRRGKIDRREPLEVLGAHMYQALFVGADNKIAAFFQKALREVPRGERLSLRLSLKSGAGEMGDWPWEYLYSPDSAMEKGFFLSTHVNLVLSRYRPHAGNRSKPVAEKGPLRLLFVSSKPSDLPSFDEQPIIKAIETLAERMPIKIVPRSDPTIENFDELLQEENPHVLHFIGHGRFGPRSGLGEIALLDWKKKEAIWVSGKVFAEFFTQARVFPRLVFLHLCDAAKVPGAPDESLAANFAALAPELIDAQIQAVVAMQYPIPNDRAIIFCRVLYQKLAEGEPIDDAVRYGRWKLVTAAESAAYNDRVFGTPVLYMHSREAIIQPGALAAQPPPAAPSGQILPIK